MDDRQTALELWRHGLAAVDARRAVARSLVLAGDALHIGGAVLPAARVRVVGAGKAAAGMALGALDVLGDRVVGGVIAVRDEVRDLGPISVLRGAHPVPDERSERAAAAVAAEVEAAVPDELVLALWSGGGSSLLSAPVPGLDADDLRDATARLLRAGVDIEALNAVRRRLSAVHGGALGARCRGPLATLLLSDVLGDAPHAIASGPTVADPTPPQLARDVLEAHGLGHLPLREDTPRPAPGPVVVVGRLADALRAVREEAWARRWATLVLDPEVTGEARAVGARMAAALGAMEGGPPMCLLCAGEPVVTVRGGGRGGRMQEAALAAVPGLEGTGATLLCAGTDGSDGPTDAAGAIVDGGSAARGLRAGRDLSADLADNDAYAYLDATGDLIRSGPTGTNVGDLLIGLSP